MRVTALPDAAAAEAVAPLSKVNWAPVLTTDAGLMVRLKLTVTLVPEVAGTALTTVSYATDISAITCVGGSVTVGGVSVEFDECTISGDNGLSGSRPTLSNPRSRQPVPISERVFTATVKSDYISNSQHNAYMAGSEAALVLTLTDGIGATCVVTANMRYDDQAVNIAGKDILSDEFTGKFVRSGAADSSAISVLYTSTDATIA